MLGLTVRKLPKNLKNNTMKNIFLTLVLCLISVVGISQSNKGKSGVSVVDTKTTLE